MSLKIALLCICFILSSQFLLKESDELHPTASQSNLGFANYTGSGATTIEVSWFTNYINSASVFYRDDTASRLKYISDQMNNTYATASHGFSIIQNPAGILDEYFIYSLNNEFASVQRVDKIYPNNSYLFTKQSYYTSSAVVYLLNSGQRGYGMTDSLETVIKNIIISVESQAVYGCDYDDLSKISDLIEQFYNGYWSVVCSSSPSIKALVLSDQGIATYVNPRTYYYVIWKYSY